MSDSCLWDSIQKLLVWHSSPVDWCEPNYATTTSIVEFYNTVSNAIFFIIPPLLMYLFQPYGRRVSTNIQFIWLLMIIIGISSTYFHATLSLAGQLLDEITILWVYSAALAFWLPKRYIPGCLKNVEHRYEKSVLVVAVVMTVCGFAWPILNAFVLMVCSIPACIITVFQIRACPDKQVKYLAKRALFMWFIAVLFWISDRVICGVWLRLGLPGLHFLWHLLVCVCTSHMVVFYAFVDALSRKSEVSPVLAFWPSDDWTTLGVPYVAFTSPLPAPKGNINVKKDDIGGCYLPSSSGTQLNNNSISGSSNADIAAYPQGNGRCKMS